MDAAMTRQLHGGLQKEDPASVALKPHLTSILLACWLVTAGVAQAQSFDKEMAEIAASLNKVLVAKGHKNVAAIDFTDLQGQPTELGRFLSEQLSVEMVLIGGVSVLDRANIKNILAEHKLTEEGLVKPANAKKLGEFSGVDVILIGTVTSLDARIILTVKALATESSELVAADKISFPLTSDLQQLFNRGISSSTTTVPATGVLGSGTSYQDASAIATKDIGPLRVVLKSVLPMKSNNSIRCTFDFINRETQRSLVVAANATAGWDGVYRIGASSSGTALGSVLRTTLVDERGTVWKLLGSGLTGLGVVSPGRDENLQSSSPAEIASLLQRRDDAGSNTFTARLQMVGGSNTANFVWGSMTPISPGQVVPVLMTFVQEDGRTVSGPPPKFLQIVSEIVIGVTTSGTKVSYSLQNVVFDRVSMPAGAP